MPIIEVAGLSRHDGSKSILRPVSLSIETGEVFAIIGPTGSGKTTLLRLIDQLDKPSAGRMLFDGREVNARNGTEVRRRISMVLQKPVVLDATVFDNVAYPLRIRNENRQTIPDKVNAMLQTVGLNGYQKRKARTLSGGETQKVALARALITDPEVLLMDEPTANLDPVSLNTIENLILRLNRERKMAIVIATHEMAQGQRLANRVGVIMRGELIQVGKPEDIFYAPTDLRVARFVGAENILRGRVTSNEGGLTQIQVGSQTVEAITDRTAGEDIDACVRPEEVTLSLEPPAGSARNTFSGVVALVALSGPLARIEINSGIRLVSLITKRSAEDLELRMGQRIHASFKATAVHIISHAGPEMEETPEIQGRSRDNQSGIFRFPGIW